MSRRIFPFLLVALLASAGCRNAPGDGRVADVLRAADGPLVVIVVDTLRSDHLPAYGYRAIATPHLDRLAADSVVFERAFSHVPLTLPSHTSLFTGLLPPAHGVRNNGGYRLAEDKATLAAGLRAQGWRTAGFVSSTVLDHATGIARGFETWDDAVGGAQRDVDVLARKRPGRTTAERALTWLDAQKDGRFLLFLHLYDPHMPYAAPEPFASRAASKYDAEILYDDDVIGGVLDRLRARGLYDGATIVFLSDHGEGLGDHGETQHGMLLYREALQVPLFVKWPHGAHRGERRTTTVGLIDVATTLFAAAGLPVTEHDGVPLFGPAGARERSVYGETVLPREGFGFSALRSVIAWPRHFIESPRPELYDVAQDPREAHDALAGGAGAAPADLADRLAHVGAGETSTAESTTEREDRLLSLGYFGGATGPGSGANPRDRIGEVETLWATAEAIGRRGRPEDALATITKILGGLELKNEQLLRLIARRFLSAGRPDLAVGLVRDLRDSRNPHSRIVAGEVALETGRAAEADTLFRSTLDGPVPQPRAWLGLGLIALRRGDAAAAEPLLERAVALDADTAEAWNALGVLRAQRGDTAGAGAAWEKAVACDPRLSDAWFNLAALRHRRGDLPGTTEALQRYAAIVKGRERERAEELLKSMGASSPRS